MQRLCITPSCRSQPSCSHFQKFFISRRFRSANVEPQSQNTRKQPFKRKPYMWYANRLGPKPIPTKTESLLASKLSRLTDDPKETIKFFEQHVRTWAAKKILHTRLISFGIPAAYISPLLTQFQSVVENGQLSTIDFYHQYSIGRFARSLEDEDPSEYIDLVYTPILFAWAADPKHESSLCKIIPETVLKHICNLFHAADCFYPADNFPLARSMHRKFIMHVGPTNSGKTYNALRALAAADRGAYAGPLRLLASEIWVRMNMGAIRPAGIEETAGDDEIEKIETRILTDAEKVAADIQIPDGVKMYVPVSPPPGATKYSRPCNMVTGEEVKIVHPDAPLASCTVEMLSHHLMYNVAVIDEIQLIASADRGSAWTNAVLGVRADEVHLCGEETAVPLVRSLLADTGDELIVNVYERLTPLQVEKQSLDGDLRKIERGDCVVGFSRTAIFGLKSKIELATKMKCAVVYGKLPAEIRTEQANLFNDPNSGYDVIVGSDAIGMGLNLKIRRVVFEAVHKWDSGSVQHLSVSQTKQIAGRAGRYGMLGDSSAGLVTSISPEGIPHLEWAMQEKIPPLRTARLPFTTQTASKLKQVLPKDCTTETLVNAHIYIARVQPKYRYQSLPRLNIIGRFLDTFTNILSTDDAMQFLVAPVPWRDPACIEFVGSLFTAYTTCFAVDLSSLLKNSPFIVALETVEKLMHGTERPAHYQEVLNTNILVLESFHKILELYSWFHLRKPVAFYDTACVMDLKPRVEVAMQYCLSSMSTGKRPGARKTEGIDFQYASRTRGGALAQVTIPDTLHRVNSHA